MKGLVICLLLFFLSGCDTREREVALQKKENLLNEREQQLLLKEKTLQAKEDEVNKRRQQLDSTTKADTVHKVVPMLAGAWQVKMTCTETTCAGSAVGDTKTEQWIFLYQGTTLLVKAMAGEQLVRVYSGFYTNDAIELAEDKSSTATQTAAKMTIRLRMVDDTHLEGQREIVRENDCRVVYALQLQKQ